MLFARFFSQSTYFTEARGKRHEARLTKMALANKVAKIAKNPKEHIKRAIELTADVKSAKKRKLDLSGRKINGEELLKDCPENKEDKEDLTIIWTTIKRISTSKTHPLRRV